MSWVHFLYCVCVCWCVCVHVLPCVQCLNVYTMILCMSIDTWIPLPTQVCAGVQAGVRRTLMCSPERELWGAKVPETGCPLQWHPVWGDAAWLQQQEPASQPGTGLPDDLPVSSPPEEDMSSILLLCTCGTFTGDVIQAISLCDIWLWLVAFWIQLGGRNFPKNVVAPVVVLGWLLVACCFDYFDLYFTPLGF